MNGKANWDKSGDYSKISVAKMCKRQDGQHLYSSVQIKLFMMKGYLKHHLLKKVRYSIFLEKASEN